MLEIYQDRDVTIPAVNNVKELYDRYAAMLLGYIAGRVLDQEVAERFLVSVFAELAQSDQVHIANWSQLRNFTSTRLPQPNVITPSMKLDGKLTKEQQAVFHLSYQLGQSTSQIAAALNQNEDSIRKTLFQAFSIMKENREN